MSDFTEALMIAEAFAVFGILVIDIIWFRAKRHDYRKKRINSPNDK